jgi:hypothetical protein
MGKTTVKRTSFCMTQETQRQLEDLSSRFGENPSQVMTRALQLLHFSLRFPNIPLRENAEREG